MMPIFTERFSASCLPSQQGRLYWTSSSTSLNSLIFKYQDFFCRLFYGETVVNTVSDHPGNPVAGYEHPDFFFLCLRQFLVDQKAGKFFLFLHAQRIKIIPWFPFSEQQREIHPVCIQRFLLFVGRPVQF